MRPFFIAETPRAGNLGHRYLVPAGCEAPSSIVERYVDTATKMLHGQDGPIQGRDFLAVGREVMQPSPAGAVRRAREILVLAGVDTQRLSPTEKKQAVSLLQHNFESLARLITQGIDWNKESQNMIVCRDELRKWSDDGGVSSLPCFHEKRTPAGRTWWILSCVLAVLIVLAGISGIGDVVSWLKRRADIIVSLADKEKKDDQSDNRDKKDFESFAADCGVKREELAKEFLHLAAEPGEDAPSGQPDSTDAIIEALKLPDVQELIKEYRKLGKVTDDMLLKFVKEEWARTEINSIPASVPSNIENAKKTRDRIAKVGKEMKSLNSKLVNRHLKLYGGENEESYKYFRLIRAIGESKTLPNLQTNTPCTPFFGQQDVNILKAFCVLFVDDKSFGFKAFPPDAQAKNAGEAFEKIANHSQEIRNTISIECEPLDLIGPEEWSQSGHVVTSYNLLRTFIKDVQKVFQRAPKEQQ